MEPKKNGTLMEKFGFKDADLTTPKHDEIVLALNREKILEIAKLCGWKDEKEIIESFPLGQFCDGWDCIKRTHKCGLPHERPLRDYEKQKEILTTKWNDGTLESFCPILYKEMKFYIEELTKEKILANNFQQEAIVKINHETPIKSGNYILGFCDGYASIRCEKKNFRFITIKAKSFKIYFEVKTSIQSFGELMRQLNTYRENTEGIWVVVCPDDRFAEAIRSQGVFFYKWIDTPKGQQNLQ